MLGSIDMTRKCKPQFHFRSAVEFNVPKTIKKIPVPRIRRKPPQPRRPTTAKPDVVAGTLHRHRRSQLTVGPLISVRLRWLRHKPHVGKCHTITLAGHTLMGWATVWYDWVHVMELWRNIHTLTEHTHTHMNCRWLDQRTNAGHNSISCNKQSMIWYVTKTQLSIFMFGYAYVCNCRYVRMYT